MVVLEISQTLLTDNLKDVFFLSRLEIFVSLWNKREELSQHSAWNNLINVHILLWAVCIILDKCKTIWHTTIISNNLNTISPSSLPQILHCTLFLHSILPNPFSIPSLISLISCYMQTIWYYIIRDPKISTRKLL